MVKVEKEHKHICEYDRVAMKTVMPRSRSCRRTATVLIDGKWLCAMHTPDKIEEREKLKQERSDIRFRRKREQYAFQLKVKQMKK